MTVETLTWHSETFTYYMTLESCVSMPCYGFFPKREKRIKQNLFCDIICEPDLFELIYMTCIWDTSWKTKKHQTQSFLWHHLRCCEPGSWFCHVAHTKKVDFLIATDLAGRGLDINGIDFVINFEVPRNLSEYVHRGIKRNQCFWWKETHIHVKRDVYTCDASICRNVCISVSKETNVFVECVYTCEKRPMFWWSVSYILVKRDVFIYEKRRIFLWKETYSFKMCRAHLGNETYTLVKNRCILLWMKQYAYIFENRRIHLWKETYTLVKRDVYICENRCMHLWNVSYILVKGDKCTLVKTDVYSCEKRRIHLWKETYKFVESGACICEKRRIYLRNVYILVKRDVYTFEASTLLKPDVYSCERIRTKKKCLHFLKKNVYIFGKEMFTFFEKKCLHFWKEMYTGECNMSWHVCH